MIGFSEKLKVIFLSLVVKIKTVEKFIEKFSLFLKSIREN